MKHLPLKHIRRLAALVLAVVLSVPLATASWALHTLKADTSSPVEGATHTYSDGVGVIYGFTMSGSSLYVRGIYIPINDVGDRTLEVPDTLVLEGSTTKYTVTQWGTSRGEIDMSNASQATKLILPNTLRYIYAPVPEHIKELHLLYNNGSTRVSYNYVGAVKSTTQIFVHPDMLRSYRRPLSLDPEEKEWQVYHDFVSEGFNPIDANITVGSENELETKLTDFLTGKNRTLADIERLTVTGPLSSDDLQNLKKMVNMTELDLTSASFTDFTCKNSSSPYYDRLHKVLLPQSDTLLTSDAFDRCPYLTEVSMPGVKKIDSSCFYECKTLTSVSAPSLVNLGDYAFIYCPSLQEVQMPKVQNVGRDAFYGCTALKDVDLPMLTTLGRNAFYGCKVLKDIDLPLVETINYNAFESCESLESVDFPRLKTLGTGVFKYCKALKSINLGSLPTVPRKPVQRLLGFSVCQLP